MRNARVTRRALLAAAGVLPAMVGAPAWSDDAGAAPLRDFLNDGGFSFERLAAAAEELAAGRLHTPHFAQLEFAADLNYDSFRRIEFRREKTFWAEEGLEFQAQFAHPGWLFTEPVTVLEFAGGQVGHVAFSPELFNYHDPAVEAAVAAEADKLGFAGVRLLHEINRPGKWDEVVVFQGASYFRALGRNSVYGLSARGLAIDTGAPSGEEFPRFSVIILERSSSPSATMTMYALLESASVCGAYSFVIDPAHTTRIEVEARLFARRKIGVLGVAPLTSMYAYGENDRVGVDDFRPEVHDSDGLLMRTGTGEVIWRPVINPGQLQISSFIDRNPRGFGLFQRDRSFESYQDAEARYERRPSCWVEPLDSWGRGAVRLVEIPSPDEYNDNIVAFWAPEGGLDPETSLTLRYRLHWGDETPAVFDSATVVATRHGVLNAERPEASATERRFAVDFQGGMLGNLPGDAVVEAIASANGAEVVRTQAIRLPDGGRWRAVIDIRREAAARSADLRCFLRLGGAALSETWSYLWA